MQGQVLEIAPSDTVNAVKVLIAARQAGELPLEEVAMYGSLVHVVAEDMENLLEPISERLRQSEIDVNHMAIIEPSLEDVFISCVR